MGGLELFTLGMLSIEELNEFSAVQADSPIFISHYFRDWGDNKFTQAIFAPDDGVSIHIPSCLGWPAVNQRGSGSEWRFSGQV
jgi:hypothetical protein